MNRAELTQMYATQDSFWRSLRFFSLYRLAVGVMFLSAVIVSGDVLNVGTEHPVLFVRSALAYVVAAILFYLLITG